MADSQNNTSKSPMDEWDEIFESEDPTRVLSPLEFEDSSESNSSATAQFDQVESDYLEQRRQSSSASKKPQALVADDEKTREISAISKTSPVYIDEQEYEESEAPASSGDYIYEDRSIASRYSRLQLFPCFLGWLVSYAVLQLGTTLYSQILSSFGVRDFGVVGNLLTAVQKDTAAATPWLVALGLTILLAYGAGGYTASRLARYAAFKQGLGVFLWGILTTIIASLFVLFAHPAGTPIVSYQHLSNNSFDVGLIGVIAFFALAFVSSSIGALFGKRYERLHLK